MLHVTHVAKPRRNLHCSHLPRNAAEDLAAGYKSLAQAGSAEFVWFKLCGLLFDEHPILVNALARGTEKAAESQNQRLCIAIP
jgi:hypothetical protein